MSPGAAARSRRRVRLLLLVAWGVVVGCAHRTGPATLPGAGPVGVYRVRIERDGGPTERFRLRLFAAEPDRIHGEVVSPLGAVLADVDGGSGQLAVSLPRERTAYVGQASAGAVERVLGVPIALVDLVAVLLGHEPAGAIAVAVERSPGTPGELPRRLELAHAGRRVTLELQRWLPLAAADADIGSGRPLPGMELRSLDELAADAWDDDVDGAVAGEGALR